MRAGQAGGKRVIWLAASISLLYFYQSASLYSSGARDLGWRERALRSTPKRTLTAAKVVINPINGTSVKNLVLTSSSELPPCSLQLSALPPLGCSPLAPLATAAPAHRAAGDSETHDDADDDSDDDSDDEETSSCTLGARRCAGGGSSLLQLLPQPPAPPTPPDPPVVASGVT
ncbi:hypothetical protein LSTR_LSTR015118 [Laodelphax striatellus]|uniref:Uncharacterized protein n=1 Tax=Laodelphax striatellus TaxID=195883 RepID=A0A482XQ97_LAOST|nr:hypothetical protein LSTR_LSTR015118 [Laodelphax striatellus]